MRINRTLWFIM